jgi:hypothetical protein
MQVKRIRPNPSMPTPKQKYWRQIPDHKMKSILNEK